MVGSSNKLRARQKCLNESGIKHTMVVFFKKILEKVLPKSLYELQRCFEKNVLNGYRVYASILDQYGLNSKIKVMYTGTGDAYIAAAHYANYVSFKGEEKIAVLVVGSKSVSNLFSLFGVENAHVLQPRQILEIIKFYLHMGDICDIEILHPHIFFRHTGLLSYMEGVHPGMDFAYMMRHVVFEDVLDQVPAKPAFVNDVEYISKLQSEKKLETNNSVLLISQATTIKPLPPKFWQMLIELLDINGFSIFTNADREKNSESVVETLFLPYKYIVPVLDYFQIFVVGTRCGLFDVINTSKCYKTALYNSGDRRGCAKTLDLLKSFSLNSMFESCGVKEYMVDENNMMDIAKKIVEELCDVREKNRI